MPRRDLIALMCVSLIALVACGGSGADASATTDSGATQTAAAITVQPSDVHVTVGREATFSVTATGSTVNYQWQQSQDHGNSWSDISGAINSSFTVDVAVAGMTGEEFRVRVTGPTSSVTSTPVVLYVNGQESFPAIWSDPSSVTVEAGQAATFSVTASGNNLIYQWELWRDGVNAVNIPGATQATYTLAAASLSDSGSQFRVKVSDPSGEYVESTLALLIVN